MSNSQILETPLVKSAIEFAKDQLQSAEGGHDWFHTQRVLNTALAIGKAENADLQIVAVSAILHDIADSKFHDGDESVGPRRARAFLENQGVSPDFVKHVVHIIENISFKNSFENTSDRESIELHVVRDADRLDAIGAIGIARCFNYGGFKNRPLYDPEIKPDLDMTKVQYKNSTAPTINHFYEKLLLLKNKMHTRTAKEMGEKRHRFMERFLDEFYSEWDGQR